MRHRPGLRSDTVAVNVSDAGALSSDRAMPAMAPVWPTPIVAAAGAVITGPLATATPIVCPVAALPRLSVAFTVIVSGATTLSVSLSVASAAFTSESEPLTDSDFDPLPPTLAPVARLTESRPSPSDSETVNVSLVVTPDSLRLTPAIASGLPTPVVTEAGAAITGSPFTVTAIEAVPAWLPN